MNQSAHAVAWWRRPLSAKERHGRFSLVMNAFSCAALRPPTWTPTSANAFPSNFFTSDRSWGHSALQVSHT